jgi:oxygen-independent coproporphyrinogen-3 oxidase
VAAFVEALRVEIALRSAVLDERFGTVRPALTSVYLGGGTPSLLPADDIDGLLDLISSRFGIASNAEVTIEVNPGRDERGDEIGLERAGVTRMSFGAQSLDDEELRRLGRRHRGRDVAEAVNGARAAGIRSVSLDLLYDIPNGSLETWSTTLEGALELAPDHLSLNALTLDDPDAEGLTGPTGDHLPTRGGARRWRERARHGQDDDRAAVQYVHAVERLAAAGWRGYEISNWARPGHESRHNLAYWERRPYAAVGPGAHAFDGSTRRWNGARLDGYLAALIPAGGGRPTLPPGGAEQLDDGTASAERLILGLRTDRGIPSEVVQDMGQADLFAWGRVNGLLVETADGRLALTTEGRLLSNELFARLL